MLTKSGTDAELAIIVGAGGAGLGIIIIAAEGGEVEGGKVGGIPNGILEPSGKLLFTEDKFPELLDEWIPGGGTYLDLGLEPLGMVIGGGGPTPPPGVDVGNKNKPGCGGGSDTGGGPMSTGGFITGGGPGLLVVV